MERIMLIALSAIALAGCGDEKVLGTVTPEPTVRGNVAAGLDALAPQSAEENVLEGLRSVVRGLETPL